MLDPMGAEGAARRMGACTDLEDEEAPRAPLDSA
jgi:hypothetical protein